MAEKKVTLREFIQSSIDMVLLTMMDEYNTLEKTGKYPNHENCIEMVVDQFSSQVMRSIGAEFVIKEVYREMFIRTSREAMSLAKELDELKGKMENVN